MLCMRLRRDLGLVVHPEAQSRPHLSRLSKTKLPHFTHSGRNTCDGSRSNTTTTTTTSLPPSCVGMRPQLQSAGLTLPCKLAPAFTPLHSPHSLLPPPPARVCNPSPLSLVQPTTRPSRELQGEGGWLVHHSAAAHVWSCVWLHCPPRAHPTCPAPSCSLPSCFTLTVPIRGGTQEGRGQPAAVLVLML